MQQLRAQVPILIVLTLGLARGSRDRFTGLTDELARCLVHAHQWALGISGALVHIQHPLHASHKLRASLGRDHPAHPVPGLELVF